MGDRLRSLFDYQKFEQNNKLGKLIEETESRYGMKALSDDDLEFVAAAGLKRRDELEYVSRTPD